MTVLPRRARSIGIKPPKVNVGEDVVLAQYDAEMDEHLQANGIDLNSMRYLRNSLRRISRSLPRQIRPKKMLSAAAILEGIALSPTSGYLTKTVSGLAGAGVAAIAIDTIVLEEIEKEEGTLLKPGELSGDERIKAEVLLRPSLVLAGMALFGDAIGLDHNRRAIAGLGAAISGAAYVAGSVMEAIEGGAIEAA